MTPIEHIRRKVLGLSQAEMADLAGVSQTTVSRWETGKQIIDASAMARVRARAVEKEGWSDTLFFSVPADVVAGVAA